MSWPTLSLAELPRLALNSEFFHLLSESNKVSVLMIYPSRAGDLMQDLKTGHLIRASPRAQFYGQLLGSSLSIIVSTTAYTLYQRAYTIPGPSFPAPTAYVWLSLARLLRKYQTPFSFSLELLTNGV
jgi:uncharacterized oligopeptide transporter (OPT) family protein